MDLYSRLNRRIELSKGQASALEDLCHLDGSQGSDQLVILLR